MTTLNKNQLVITINTTSPEEHRNQLVKAIANVIKWRSQYDMAKPGEDEDLHKVGELLESLANVK